jgi:hypothetical protein
MSVLADISTGHHAGADVLFLIAVLLFIVLAVVAAVERTIPMVLVAAGLAAVSLGWLVL